MTVHSSNYSCVLVLVRVSVCLCVCLHDNSEKNRSRNAKLEYLIVYEKVKVTVGVQKFPQFTTIQTARSNFGTSYEPYIKHVCSSDTNVQNL